MITAGPSRIVVLAGGYGGAKLSHGLALALDLVAPASGPSAAVSGVSAGDQAAAGKEPGGGADLSIIVNTGDDLEIHGLHVSPDLDTVMYTLAGLANAETGWGVRDETWSAAAMLERYGRPAWFRLGDRDLATNLLRTEGLRAGRRLTEMTAELAKALGIRPRLLPMTDDPVRTRVRTRDGWLDFQDWFVRRGHRDDALELRFDGSERARPALETLAVVAAAELIVFAPSNPFVSIGTILAVPGMAEALLARSVPRIAVSPIVGGEALRGPADRMFETLGTTAAGSTGEANAPRRLDEDLGREVVAPGAREASALAVAQLYAERHPGLVETLVIDRVDASQAAAIDALGIRPLVTGTVMRTDDDRRRLAADILAFAAGR